MSKTKRLLAAAVVLAAGCIIGGAAYVTKRPGNQLGQETPAQSRPTYSLKLESGSSYPDPEVPELTFRIEDKQGQTLTTFDEVHQTRLHLVAVRKDRTAIVYLEPSYDESSGLFTVSEVAFPTAGEYRIFAEFQTSDEQTRPDAQQPTTVVEQDISIGDVRQYNPQPVTRERFASSDGEFDLNVFLAPHDPTDPGLAAGSSSSFAVSVYKNGQPFRALEQIEDSRGSLVMFGPNLEYLHVHTHNDEVHDTYVLSFSVIFPAEGLYTAFLRTKAEGEVKITDYVLDVAESPTSNPVDMPPPSNNSRH